MFNRDCVIEFWDRGCLPVLREMWWFGFEGIERKDVLSGGKERGGVMVQGAGGKK